MQKVFLSNRTDFAIAEKAREAKRPETALNHGCIMMRIAEKICAAPVATAEASSIYDLTFQLFMSPVQEGKHVLIRGGRIAPLELNRLSGPGMDTDGDHPGIRIHAQEISNQEIAPVKLFEILIHHQTDEQITLAFLLFLRSECAERLDQHFVGRTIRYLIDEVFVSLRNGPGIADGSAPLGDNAGQRDFPAHGDRDQAVCMHISVQIELGGLSGQITAGQASDHRKRGVGAVPLPQPGIAIQRERIGKSKPAVRSGRLQPSFVVPVSGAVSLLHVRLPKVEWRQFRPGQVVQPQTDASAVLDLLAAAD